MTVSDQGTFGRGADHPSKWSSTTTLCGTWLIESRGSAGQLGPVGAGGAGASAIGAAGAPASGVWVALGGAGVWSATTWPNTSASYLSSPTTARAYGSTSSFAGLCRKPKSGSHGPYARKP